MVTWLAKHAPRRFDELAIPNAVRTKLLRSSLDSNPPHLLLAGPAGVGKTAIWLLVARQVLGPSWKLSTHVLQARDLARQAKAMQKFEYFLRPDGSASADTLTGRMTLTAFDANMWEAEEGDAPPAGRESEKQNPISRLVVIEDADHLGHLRQAFLRRIMESESSVTRFIFTARSPSRLIDALRSRCQMVMLPSVESESISGILDSIVEAESLVVDAAVLKDVVHVAQGNLRKSIYLLELLDDRGMLNDRDMLHRLISATTLVATRRMIETALRGKVVDWRWERQGSRNVRKLSGAISDLDLLMDIHSLDGGDVIMQVHELLLSGRFLLPKEALEDLLESLSLCDVRLQRSMHARIQLESFLHEAADIGRRWNLAVV